MDELLARKLSRQLRLLNIFLVFFMLVFLSVVVVGGIFVYAAVKEVRKAENSITNLQSQAKNTLNVKDNACDSSGSLSQLLKSQSDICN